MFRNKVLVRAAPPSSASPPQFLLRQVSFPAATPSLELDILCCALSRRHRLACLPEPPTDALLVYQRRQSRAAVEAASEIAAAHPDATVGEEEEVVCLGSLVAKAVDCGLRSLMLEHGWSCVGESIYVQSTFAASEETGDHCALNVEVRSGRSDGFEFVVSPDALRFTTHKMSDVVASPSMMETYQHGKQVILDDCSPLTACTVIPTLQEGHVVGFSKTLPSGQCLDKFAELCSLKHGLQPNSSYAAVKVAYEAFQWLPSSLILQRSGLQPARKSVRASKAMSSLRSFIELVEAWNFFGQDQLGIKEQVLLDCTATTPAWEWDKLTLHSARAGNSEGLDLAPANVMAKDQLLALDFRTPKPAVMCSTSDKLCSTKFHEIALPLDSDVTGNGTSSINHACQPQRTCESQVALLKPSFSRNKPSEKNKTRYSSEHSGADSSTKSNDSNMTGSQATVLKPSFSRNKPAEENKTIHSSEHSGADSSTKSNDTSLPKSQATLLKPSFSRNKPPEKKKTRYSSEQSSADTSTKLNAASLPKSSCKSFPTASHANPINLSSANLLKQVFQDPKHPKRKHAEFLDNTCQVGSTKVAIHHETASSMHINCSNTKDYVPDFPQEITAMPDTANDVLSAKEITAATKLKTKPEVVKDEFTKNVIDHQKNELTKKETKFKAKPVIDKDKLTSKAKKKTKPDVNKDELTAKVMDHHTRGVLHLLTVADLKCFLSEKKAKVGGTKEVLIQRTIELLS